MRAACPGWNMRLERHYTADGLDQSWTNKILVPTPLTPSTSRHQSKQCQSLKAKNDDMALQTTEPPHAPNRRIGGKRTAPKSVVRLGKMDRVQARAKHGADKERSQQQVVG